MILLPEIKDESSGLIMSRGKWCIFYYEDDKTRRFSTGSDNISTAVIFRDNLHARLIAEGAEYKTRTKPSLQEAIDDPEGSACIYKLVSYQVIVDGVQVGTSRDPEQARLLRNKYIEDNYDIQ